MNVETNKEVALQQATAWFAKLDSSAVSDEAKSQFFAWLDASETHQQAYIEIEQLWGKLEIVKQLPRSGIFNDGNWFSSAFGRWGQVGAMLSVLAIATVTLLFLNQPPDVSEHRYVTAVGERLDFRLEDGSLLQLNTDSAVSVRMDTSHRLLTLIRGEAFFDIAPNADRPLIVRTTGGLVRVLGTQFNIRQTGSGSIVSVIEGRVAVAVQGEARPLEDLDFNPGLTLVANQQVKLMENQPMAALTVIDSDTVTAWRQGQLIYEGNTLADVIDDLNRYFPGTIRLEEQSLGDLEIVGVINLRNKTATLAAIEATFGVQVVSVSENLTLIQRRD
jgi:transmembrane sensor